MASQSALPRSLLSRSTLLAPWIPRRMTLLSTLRSKVGAERTSASALAGSLLVLGGHTSRTRFTRQSPWNPFWALGYTCRS
jgi:hypothetical protein